ncbi:hypothetical protein [Streptomyces sp. WG5]
MIGVHDRPGEAAAGADRRRQSVGHEIRDPVEPQVLEEYISHERS